MLRIYLIILFSVSCSFFLNGIAIILVTQAKEKTDREDFKVELSLHVFFYPSNLYLDTDAVLSIELEQNPI